MNAYVNKKVPKVNFKWETPFKPVTVLLPVMDWRWDKSTVTQVNKDVHTKTTSNKADIKEHALIAQEDALDMTVANSPQHTKEEHKPLIYMQQGNRVN